MRIYFLLSPIHQDKSVFFIIRHRSRSTAWTTKYTENSVFFFFLLSYISCKCWSNSICMCSTFPTQINFMTVDYKFILPIHGSRKKRIRYLYLHISNICIMRHTKKQIYSNVWYEKEKKDLYNISFLT